MSLEEFEKIFREDIVEYYVQNQNKFDSHGIHGCLHISRSLIICRLISKELSRKGIVTNIDNISYAVAFHDSGRQANGVDLWENLSSSNCYNYLIKKGNPNAKNISSLILKNDSAVRSKSNDYDFLCLYDTDVLEILRPSTGVGMRNFNNSYLKLKGVLNYDVMFNEVLQFILETENLKQNFNDHNSLNNLITYIILNKSRFPKIYESIS
jgi:hypothetical protein